MENKFLKEEEYQEYLSEQRQYYETVELKHIAYSLLSKYGFNDGDDIPSEIDDILKGRAKELANALNGVCGFEAYVIRTAVHNPYYVRFKKGEMRYNYQDFPPEVKWKIDKILDNLDG